MSPVRSVWDLAIRLAFHFHVRSALVWSNCHVGQGPRLRHNQCAGSSCSRKSLRTPWHVVRFLTQHATTRNHKDWRGGFGARGCGCGNVMVAIWSNIVLLFFQHFKRLQAHTVAFVCSKPRRIGYHFCKFFWCKNKRWQFAQPVSYHKPRPAVWSPWFA